MFARNHWAISLVFVLASTVFSQRVLYKYDFESGLGDCIPQGDVSVIEAPLGGKYVQCALAESKGTSRISIPAIPLTEVAAVEIKVKYRATRNGGQHFGPWVYIAVSDGTKTISEQFILCSATTTWREGVVRFLCPPGAKVLNVNPRLQATEGRVDWDDIVVTAVDAESLQKPKETKSTVDRSLAVVTTFTLEKTADGYVLTDGKTVLKNENQKSGLPLQFTLPDEWCENTAFVYEVKTDFATYWNTRNAAADFHTIFAMNRNIMGYMTNSSTVTFLNRGKSIMSRIIGETFGDKAQVMEPMTVESNRPYSVLSRFSATESSLYLDGDLLGKAPVPRVFRWMKHQPFLVGAEGNNLSLLHAEITSFSLAVCEEKVKCVFAGNDGGYFYGIGAPHTVTLAFPRDDGDVLDTVVTVKDINGKEAGKLSPLERTKRTQTFALPALAFGYYTLSALVSKDVAQKKIERSIAIMPEVVHRERAERSSFGATEEWPLSRTEFNPVMTDALFAKMAEMGIRWFRVWVQWDHIEEAPGVYYFDGLDALAAQSRKHGISLVLTLFGGKKPFQSVALGTNAPNGLAPMYVLPSDMKLWISYVTTLANRYKGKIRNYQIWNETDTRFFIYPFTAEAYLDILKQSAAAIRAVDAAALIHLAGFCSAYEPVRINQGSHLPDDKSYGLAEFYNLRPQSHFDISDYHFYHVNEPGQSFDGYVPIVNGLTQFLADRGDGSKPLWNSEAGILSTPDSERVGKSGGLYNVPLLTERDHAVRIVTREVQSLGAGIAVTMNYKFRESGGFGIVRQGDLTPKPVFPAMVNLANMIYGRTFDKQRLKQNANVRCYTFTNAASTLAVIWTIAGQEILTIRSESGADVFITDMMGNRKKALSSLLVTEGPVYIESKDRFAMSGIISMALPDMIIENEPYDITLSMNNPFTEAMKVIVAASISNAVVAKQEMSVPAQSEKTETVRISGAGGPLAVQGAIRGALTQEFSIEQKIVARKAVRIDKGVEGVIDITLPRQVKIGGKTMDGQGRVISEGQWRGAADLSAKGAISVSDRTISFSIVVMDDVLAPAEKDLYNGDAVELFIDMRAPADKKGMAGVYQVVVGANGKIWAARNKMPEGFQASAAVAPGGWKLTGSFTLAANVSDRFGFDVSLDDADDAGGRKTQMVWAGSEDNHRDASGYGIVIIK